MQASVPSGDDPYLGLVLDGQYRLESLAGSGSMARVYRARHLTVERDVAVKILRREFLTQSEIVNRFRREAQIAASLAHPNVIVVHSVGEVPHQVEAIGGEPYVALELLEGPPLSKLLLDAGGSLPLSRALHVVLAVCDALGEAHAHGIVHRDVKPDNIMLVQRGGDPEFVKVLDFGLAKTLHDAREWKTRAGAVLGTPRYVSPEGAEGRAVTPASDCYSIATVLYECLTGHTPFEGENAVAILVQHATAAPRELTAFETARGVPEDIARVIMTNLSKDPRARAADARELGRALVTAARAANIDAELFGLPSTLLGATRKSPVVQVETLPSRTSIVEEAPAGEVRAARDGLPARATTSSGTSSLIARRLAVFFACFILGAAVALGAASGMGAFAGAHK